MSSLDKKRKPVVCSSCGVDLAGSADRPFIGVHISLLQINPTNEAVLTVVAPSEPHPEVARVREMFGDSTFRICICCWLKAMGVKPKKS